MSGHAPPTDAELDREVLERIADALETIAADVGRILVRLDGWTTCGGTAIDVRTGVDRAKGEEPQ